MKFRTITIIAILLIFRQFLFSQSANPDTIPAVSLDEVVISVNKTEQMMRTVAQQVEVIQATQIQNSQTQTTADLIGFSGQVFIQRSQLGGGSPVIRGFEASRILLVIDGVRMNNIIYRAGHLQNIITIDHAILDRAEVLFGPSSTMYGSDALGGVIALYTRNPSFAEGTQKTNLIVNAATRYGSADNEIYGHVDFNIGGKKWASLTSFTCSRFDDLVGGKNQNPFYDTAYGVRPYYVERINGKDSLVSNSNRFKQVQSGYTQYDLLQKVSFRQNDNVIHNINLQFSNSTDVPRYDRLTDPGSGGQGLKYAEWYYGPQTRVMGVYNLNVSNHEGFFNNLHAGLSYQRIDESRHSRNFGNTQLQSRVERVNVIGGNLDFQKVYKRNNFRYGLDAQFNTLKSTADQQNINTDVQTPLSTRYPAGQNIMTYAALYFSHTLMINDHLTLNDGARIGYFYLHSTFGDDTTFYNFPYTYATQKYPIYSASIGLVDVPTDDLKLSILFSTGYRSPNVDDLSKVFDSSPGEVIVPNDELKPEKTFNSELGVTKLFGNSVSWENVIYYTQFYNAIVTEPFTFNGQDSIMYDGELSQVMANQNEERAYIYGFASNLSARFTDHLQMSFDVNYTYGRIKTDTTDYPLDHIPPFMARLEFNYTWGKFSSDFFVDYNSWKKLKNYNMNGEDNQQYATPEGMPAWFTVNFRAAYQVHELVSVQAGVDNIFDTQYRTFASGINGPGRNIWVSVIFHY
jgi:hemoglobin/transferrin/lactoferrin receptor protein